MEIKKRLSVKDKKCLYIEVSSDIYDWIHDTSSMYKVSKAKFVDTVLRQSMVSTNRFHYPSIRHERVYAD